MTTTISTIGYGDFKGFIDTEGVWGIEMIYMFLVTYGGIMLFASVTREIFTYNKLRTVNKMIAKRMTDMENYLVDIGNTRKDKRFPDYIIEDSKAHIKDSIESSTRFFFEEN